jgi:hypothetical protein
MLGGARIASASGTERIGGRAYGHIGYPKNPAALSVPPRVREVVRLLEQQGRRLIPGVFCAGLGENEKAPRL